MWIFVSRILETSASINNLGDFHSHLLHTHHYNIINTSIHWSLIRLTFLPPLEFFKFLRKMFLNTKNILQGRKYSISAHKGMKRRKKSMRCDQKSLHEGISAGWCLSTRTLVLFALWNSQQLTIFIKKKWLFRWRLFTNYSGHNPKELYFLCKSEWQKIQVNFTIDVVPRKVSFSP